ncbi:MAG TPA: carboxypeptidase-like regulatory domain-containing protein, partial [Thermoanaerobaculia bacterium]|nr:carboxypeptidase-like regulatory domain-containing protein [Thermoanaerobaculia bacterium]
ELMESAASAGIPAFEEDAAGFAASGADFVTFAVGNVATNPFAVSLEDARSRRTLSEGDGLPPWEIPGAALLPLGDGEAPPMFGLVTAPSSPPYILHLAGRSAEAADVAVTFPDAGGGFVHAVLFGLEIPVGGEARVVVDPARPEAILLDRDEDGDGAFTRESVATTALVLSGPELVSARVIGPEILAGASPLGTQVAILFDRVVDEETAADVASYEMVDNAVRVARRQLSGRLVFAALERPEGPYVPVRLAVDGMKDTRGTEGPGGDVPLLSLLADPGAVVSGRVLTAEGEPAVPGRIVYTATGTPTGAFLCQNPAGIASVALDGNGRYELRYVRQDPCGPFSIVAQDPVTQARSEVSASVRAAGQRIELDVVLFGRGSVAGQVRARVSGQPIAGAKVVAVSVIDPQIGGAAETDADGRYLVPGITVGPVSVRAAKGIAAGLGAGRIDRAGTTATVDVLLDTGSVTWSGVVRTKKGAAPAVVAPGAQVVYSIDDTPVGVTRTDATGKFAFAAMPAGSTRVDAAISIEEKARVSRVTAEGDEVVQDVLIVIPEDAELGTVRGIVRLPSGERAGDVLVRAGSRAALTSRPVDGVPESGGEFVLTGVPLGDTFLFAESRDGKRTGSARVSLSQAARDVPTAITLSGLGTAVFTVVDPLGLPVKDVEVRLQDCAEDPCGCTSSVTSTAGIAEFANLRVGAVYAKAFFGGDVAQGSASITRDGDRAVDIIRLNGIGTIEGVVLDHRGLPALGADLEVHSRIFVNDGVSQCGLVPGISHRFRTREDGHFRFSSVSAGPVSVTASHAFYPTKVAEQVVLLHGRTEELT